MQQGFETGSQQPPLYWKLIRPLAHHAGLAATSDLATTSSFSD
jgi:hypothetical protein